jgi:hypothetical protein
VSVLVRAGLVVLGLAGMAFGLAIILRLPEAAIIGLQLVAAGAVLVVAVVIERTRYRSDAADRTNAAPGPGGGEPADARIEGRFRATSEVFIDPSTGHRMRVLIDPATGDRRYIAEG